MLLAHGAKTLRNCRAACALTKSSHALVSVTTCRHLAAARVSSGAAGAACSAAAAKMAESQDGRLSLGRAGGLLASCHKNTRLNE